MTYCMILCVSIILLEPSLGIQISQEGKFSEANCQSILDRGLDKDFFRNVVHGIHSITLEDLWFYFDKDIPEFNNIPTVNTNLSSPDLYFSHAPRSLPREKDILDKYLAESQYLRTLDFILRNEAPDFLVRGPSLLEKLAHHLHMKELWDKASNEYTRMKSDPPSDAFCSCALDYPSRMVARLEQYAVDYRCFHKTKGILPEEGLTEEEACAREATVYEDENLARLGSNYDVGMLKDDEDLHQNWRDYKFLHMSSMMPQESIKDIAFWLFCRVGRDVKGIY